jgi:L-iditol 2-dehydrogenase
MKALFIGEAGKVALKEVGRPSVRKGEILVEMKSCGVCGTDLEKVRGEAMTPPVLGHEVVGKVAEVGVGVNGIRPGERVFTHHHAPCYDCEVCGRGEYTLCSEFPKHNISPGGFSEYYVVPEWNVSRGTVLPLPDSVTYEEGSFIEPLGCCIRGLAKIDAENFRSAIIYGAGPVGLTHLMLLQRYGYTKIAVTDPSDYRLSFASKLGATTINPRDTKRSALDSIDGASPEVAIVATSSSTALVDAVRTVSSGGRILLFGAPAKGSAVSIDTSKYFLRGITLQASYSTSEKETAMGAKMLEAGELEVSRLVTHRFSLKEASEAFKVAGEQMCIKAIVNG